MRRRLASLPPEGFAIAAIACTVLFKLGLLAWHGPLHLPDTSAYIEFAELMRMSSDWLHHVDLHESPPPHTAFRALGYPAVLAAAMAVAGNGWPYFVVVLQIGLAAAASFVLFQFSRALGGSTAIGLLVVVAHGTGLGAILDVAILTDSLNASLLLIVAGVIAYRLVVGRPPTVGAALWLGLLVMAAFLLREAGQMTHWLYLPLVLAWAYGTSVSRHRAVAVLAVFLLPLHAASTAIESWNESRSGERFITTAAQTTLLLPAVLLRERGVPILDGDPRFDGLRLDPGEDNFQKILRINAHLIEAKGLSAVEVGRLAYRTYFRGWAEAPAAMATLTLREYAQTASLVYFMPFHTAMKSHAWASGERSIANAPPTSALAMIRDRPVLALPFAVISLGRVLTIGLFLVFAVGVPLFAWRSWRGSGRLPAEALAMLSIWVLASGFITAYALVHLEARYILPVDSLVVAVSLSMIWKLRRPSTGTSGAA